MSDAHQDLPLFSLDRVEGESPAGDRGPLRPDASLSAAIALWGEELEGSGSAVNTIKAFTGDLRLVAKYLGSGQAINTIGTHDLKNFLDWMLNKRGVPCSPKTYARRVTSIKAFFRWLNEAGILQEDPANAIPQQTVLSPLPEVLSPEQQGAALKAAAEMAQGEEPDTRPNALLLLLLETGIKKGECLSIHLNHIDLNNVDGPILWVWYQKVSKRYRERKLPLSETWVEAYKDYLNQFEPTDRLFPYSPRRLEYLLEEIGEAAGLEEHLSFNMCRWTSALNDYRSGMEGDRIRQKLGISKIQWREVSNKLDRLAAIEEKNQRRRNI